MKHFIISLLFFITFLINNTLFAQEQNKISPEEIAIKEAEILEKELKLTPSQLFYVDSVLQYNYSAMNDEFEAMKARGGQDSRSYQAVNKKWIDKNLEAFKLILDEQQYIMYLKKIGRGKEYKKGKDGKYYKKEDKKGKGDD